MTGGCRIPIRSVLVAHRRPEEFREAIEADHPGIAFHWATTAADMASALAASRPDAVFAIRQPGLNGPEHREAALYSSLRWFHVGGSGYEHLLPLDRPELCLTNGRGVLAGAVAETAISGMLALNGRLLAYLHQQRRREWRPLPFRSIAGQTLLIVGLGAIGLEVARRAKALGMRVLATSRMAAPDPAVDELHPHASLPGILDRADVVSLHARATPQNKHLFGAAAFAAMKRGAILINTARGSLADEQALVAALDDGWLGGAYLDVFEAEPLMPDSPLWGREDVLITPHNADGVADWAARMAAFFSDNLRRWQAGLPLLNDIRLDEA